VDIVAVNPGGTLYVSGHIEDWEALRTRGIDTIVDMDGAVDPGIPEHLRERRPGALFNETFAAHVQGLPARRIRVDTL
jgi:hypothetical protein